MPTVVSTAKKRMEIIPDNCVGCHLCEIACSYVKFGEFNPTMAFVEIQQDEENPGYWKAEFTDQCDVCGFCYAACHYDAIKLEKIGSPANST